MEETVMEKDCERSSIGPDAEGTILPTLLHSYTGYTATMTGLRSPGRLYNTPRHSQRQNNHF